VARRGLGPGSRRRERLAAEAARLFGLHDGKYGSPRITVRPFEALGYTVILDRAKNPPGSANAPPGAAARH